MTELTAAFLSLGLLGSIALGALLLLALLFAFFERGFPAFLALCGGVALLAWSGAGLFASLAAHPLHWAGGALAYLAIGSAWSIARFRIYAGELKIAFRDFRDEWLRERGADSLEALSPEALAEFRDRAGRHMALRAGRGGYPADPRSRKSDILFWMGWWPVSLLSYLLDDPIRRMLETLFRAFSGIYGRIAAEQSSEYLEAMGKAAPKR